MHDARKVIEAGEDKAMLTFGDEKPKVTAPMPDSVQFYPLNNQSLAISSAEKNMIPNALFKKSSASRP